MSPTRVLFSFSFPIEHDCARNAAVCFFFPYLCTFCSVLFFFFYFYYFQFKVDCILFLSRFIFLYKTTLLCVCPAQHHIEPAGVKSPTHMCLSGYKGFSRIELDDNLCLDSIEDPYILTDKNFVTIFIFFRDSCASVAKKKFKNKPMKKS